MAEENPEDATTDEASPETPEASVEPDLDDAEGESESPASDPLAEAALEIENLQDRALRAQAELENVRRRAARDVENAHKYALERFSADLLPVLDSLETAVEATVGAGEEDAETLGVTIKNKDKNKQIINKIKGGLKAGMVVASAVQEPTVVEEEVTELPDITDVVDRAAQEAATSEQNDKPLPSDAQIEAGNYEKGHIKGRAVGIPGISISVENPDGSWR